MRQQHMWRSLIAQFRRIPHSSARGIRAIAPLILTLTLILGAALLLGASGQPRTNTTPVGAASPRPAPLLIARADVHAETLLHGKDLELNLAISQMDDDCQVALNGGVCLRYSIVLDEKPMMAGYGVIPQADVHMAASSIGLQVDTSKVPGFVFTVGAGGPISIIWKMPTPAAGSANAQINKAHTVTAQGHIASYIVPSSGVIATIIYQ